MQNVGFLMMGLTYVKNHEVIVMIPSHKRPNTCIFNDGTNCSLFVWVEALRSSQHFFRDVGTFSSSEPVLSNEDEVSCSRTQQLVRF